MAVGSMIAGKLSGDHVEYGLIPLGAILMAVMGFVLGCEGVSRTLFTICLAFLGIGGGMFIVPLAAVLQHRPPADRKGAVQGAASWLSWVGISAAALLQKELNIRLHWTPGQIFWSCSACAVVAGIYVTLSRPGALPSLLKRWMRGHEYLRMQNESLASAPASRSCIYAFSTLTVRHLFPAHSMHGSTTWHHAGSSALSK